MKNVFAGSHTGHRWGNTWLPWYESCRIEWWRENLSTLIYSNSAAERFLSKWVIHEASVFICAQVHAGFWAYTELVHWWFSANYPLFSSPKAVRVKHSKKFPSGFSGHVISMNAIEKRAGPHTYLLVKSCREIVPTYIGVRSFQLFGSTLWTLSSHTFLLCFEVTLYPWTSLFKKRRILHLPIP